MSRFQEFFGHQAQFFAEAPGRVNLIGEHTDYNGGFVLPTAIPQRTRVELSPRDDDQVEAASRSQEGLVMHYRLGHEVAGGNWGDYLMGATSILGKQGFRLSGFSLWVESDVPLGSGLSSSAALLVSFLRVLRRAFELELDDLALARTAQRVENEFVGARVGIMDPIACTLCDIGTALFLDTRDLRHESLRLPLQQMELVVIHSGISHRISAGGGYNERRRQCEQACQELGIEELRDLGTDQLGRLEKLSSDTLRRRARHVITENARVLAAVRAIRERDLGELGRLFLESHASMRDDYEVSLPEIDTLVDLLAHAPGAFGARLTGGGFGGSVVAICEQGAATELARTVAREYTRKTGQHATVLVS